VGWVDPTVDAADTVRDLCSDVIAWTQQALSMGDYVDYNLMPPGSAQPAAGVCHRRDGNSRIRVWMVYFGVADLEESLSTHARGGEVIAAPRRAGNTRYAIVKDFGWRDRCLNATVAEPDCRKALCEPSHGSRLL
jgi:predicted enzyme related to lactoylglutathione lyase